MKIIYISETNFLKPNASSNRIFYNSKSITLNNEYEVTLIGINNIRKTKIKNFELYNIRNKHSVFLKYFVFFLRGIIAILILHKNKIKADVIIYYGCSCRYLIPLIFYCKINKIKLISDIVEWYDYNHLPLGKFGPAALDTCISMNFLIKKTDGIVTVSSYLEKFYKTHCKNIVKIPILIDSSFNEESNTNIFDEKYLNIIYAGIPGKKDLLKTIIKVVETLNKEKYFVKLHLFGPTIKESETYFNNNTREDIISYGYIDQKDVHNYLVNADFSIIIRPQMRFANAGFPTKFVESLNAGIPIIANITSDLGLYLKDNYNGFIIENTSFESIANKIREISRIPKKELKYFKINSKKTAVNNFDYKIYSPIWHNFLIKTMNK